MKYITNNTKIILFIGGKSISVEKTDNRYAKIVKVFELPSDEQEDAVLRILEPSKVSVKSIHGQNGFEVVDEDIFYKGEKLPFAFATKIKSIIRDGLPLEHFEKFWENLEQNPSYAVLHEIGVVDFLEYAELPITEDGHFLAYRGVQDGYYSKSGNPDTKVLQGTVNSRGQIYNGIGEIIEVKRNGVTEDRSVSCHNNSLHIGSKDYATSWASKVIVVKVNPKDVVSVPYDCGAQKCRVCKYEVLYDYVGEVKSSVVDSSGKETIVTNDAKDRNEFIDKVANYLNRRTDRGYEEATIRQIQNSFSPEYPSKESILDSLQQLGYFWKSVDGALVVAL